MPVWRFVREWSRTDQQLGSPNNTTTRLIGDCQQVETTAHTTVKYHHVGPMESRPLFVLFKYNHEPYELALYHLEACDQQ